MKLFKLFSYLTLQIEPTRECNLNCKICMRKNLTNKTGHLSFENFKKIIDKFDFKHVALHGWGEPLLNPEIFKMVRYAESKGISSSLITNGTLIKERILDEIFNSNLSEIAFGIYELDSLIKRLSKLESLIEMRRELKSKRPKIYLDITIYKDNYDEIEEMIKIAKDVGVDAVTLHRLFNVYKVDPDVKYISEEEEKTLFSKINRLKKELKLEIFLPKPHTLPCNIVKYSIFVTWDGQVTPCCFLPEHSFDTIFNLSMKDLILYQRKFIENMRNHPICSKCRW